MHIILKRPDQNNVIPTQTFKYTQLIEERTKKDYLPKFIEYAQTYDCNNAL